MKLSADGVPDVAPNSVALVDNGYGLRCVFDLRNRAHRTDDVTVTNPNGQFGILRSAFTHRGRALHVTPSGGDTGVVSVLIEGNNDFPEGTTFKLARKNSAGAQGRVLGRRSAGFGLTVQFHLRGASRTTYDVVATLPDSGTIVIPGAFTVVPGIGGAAVYVDILGDRHQRVGFPSSYTFVIGNRGNIDAQFVPVFIQFPSFARFQLLTPLVQLPQPEGLQDPVDYGQIPIALPRGNGMVLPLIVPYLPAGQTPISSSA